MITKNDIIARYKVIKDHIYKTPLFFSESLSKVSGANVYLKLENMQHTGSFKLRGVLSKLSTLKENETNTILVAASTGNHAAAFGFLVEKLNYKGVLFLPTSINKSKLTALKELPIEIIYHGTNSSEAEARATEYAKKTGAILIHPYNDKEIIKGQGSVGLEIQQQLPEVDQILVPVGGGGLIAGIACYFSEEPEVSIVGCQPINASEMHQSIQQNEIVPPSTLPTISDASAGGIDKEAITFDLCKQWVSNFELISEEAIEEALAFMIYQHGFIIEPTSALTISPLLNSKQYTGKNVVLVITGRKINHQLLKNIIQDNDNNNS